MISWSNRRLSSQQTLLKPAAARPCWLGKSLEEGDGSSSHWGRLARTGRPALEPVRVYVGLRSADTPENRAKLALEELKRVGGFERSVLIVVTPTGTGWVDPASLDRVEYLHDGSVASVALQYSYLASWLSLLVEPGYGAHSGLALFKELDGDL